MEPMREIGRALTAEQNLTGGDITWLIAMAHAVLRAFAWTEGQPMRSLAATLNISPQTLYTTLRLVVQAMLWVRRGQTSVATLASRLQELQARLASVEPVCVRTRTGRQASAVAHAEVQRLTRVLTEAQAQVSTLQVEVARLQAQGGVMQDRLIVVLKMSGRCTIRSIVEVLHAKRGLGLHVSVGYVHGVIAQAGGQAHSAWERVLQVVPLSGAVCLDEVFFKEMACQVLGIVMVDPLTGLVLRLERCRVHPHIWRKAFATAFVDNGGDAERLRVFMGWSSTEMAVVYVDSSLKRLQETHQRVGDCFHVRESVSSQ